MSDIKHAYNTAAEQYREKYDAIPARIDDVNKGLSFIAPVSDPLVVEIGCAYGREASYLMSKTNRYFGIDVCDAYINMAKKEISGGSFSCVDVMDYDFPAGVDAVFAFASLLHSPKEDVAVVLQRVAQSLHSGGIIFLSLKRHEQYETSVETDDLVSRRFYYYTRQTIIDVSPDSLQEVFYEEQDLSGPWFTMVLQKK